LRRVLQQCDDAQTGGSVKLGPFVLSSSSAGIATLLFNLMLFILVAASTVMFAEFPCESFGYARCFVDLQSFHICVYFIIVSLATVGYGDFFPGTNFGRLVVSLVIVIALVFVPLQISRMSDLILTHAEAQNDRMEKTLGEVYSLLRAQSQYTFDKIAIANASAGDSNETRHMWAIQQLRKKHSDAELKKICDALGLSSQRGTEAQVIVQTLFVD
jgi:hypothetical protein